MGVDKNSFQLHYVYQIKGYKTHTMQKKTPFGKSAFLHWRVLFCAKKCAKFSVRGDSSYFLLKDSIRGFSPAHNYS